MLLKRKAKRVPVECRPLPHPEVVIQKGFGIDMPPQRGLVQIYFDQKGMNAQAEHFYDFYQKANWSSPKGAPYRNWKQLASEWIFNYEQERRMRRRLRDNLRVQNRL